jgi:two-component system, NtrC family, sensor kinase
MAGEFLLAFFMFRYLRRSLKDSDLLPQWDKILLGGMVASIALIVAEATARQLRPFTPWVAYSFLLYIIYLINRKEEFKQGRSYLIAIFPFIAASLLSRIVETVNPRFYRDLETYFEVAIGFSFVWMIVMVIITNRQKKALSREREKTLEEERQNKIMAK